MGPEGLEPSTASAPGLYPQNSGWYPTKLDDSPCSFINIITSFKLVYHNPEKRFIKFLYKYKTKDTFLFIDKKYLNIYYANS